MSSMLTRQMASRHQPTPELHAAELQLVRDEQFLGMLAGFRRSGGLNRAQDVSNWLEDGAHHKPETLKRWMAHNEVIHFDWHLRTWLPMFQFDVAALAPRVAVGLVLIELHDAFDNWAVAQWFAQPNSVLEGRNPAEVLGAEPGLVIEAARCTRSLVRT